MTATPTATEPADPPVLLRADADGITTLILNRPQQYNALSSALLIELQAAIDAIARDESVRVVVIAGTGKAFCAGHDLKEMRAHADRKFIKDVFQRCSRLMLSLTRLPQPVIARAHGIVAAAGCQLVAQCDLAVAAEGARFATSGINVGLFCATPGVALTRNISRKRAMEMLMTGDFIDADTALAYGLINRVVPLDALDAEVKKLAQSIIAKTPVAVAAGKKIFYEQIEAGLEQAYELASETMVCNMMTEDAAEGIDAFMQKRKPQWKGK
ncbi:MAG: enoyl-CoA hydratase [Burkholderiales bacterium]|nr:enoyl-CoA hydratase [Burkholderiales bacterium]